MPPAERPRSRASATVRAVRPVPQVRAAGAAVEAWGSAHGTSRRDEFPWRHTRDPWAVLVSETLAQQTQLSRVVPAYHRFLDRFPTPATCAASPLGDVLRAWEGMGYNRRARNLHVTAREVVDRHGGAVPDDLDALLALPGVGPYTARAVLAFAFGRDVGVVDTNAGRVLARAVAGRPVRPAEAQGLVDAMVPPGRGWSFGQALLDLGATVCTGSDRQGRGRLIAALRAGPVGADAVAAAAGWADDPARADRVLRGLEAEGLVVRDGHGAARLP